MILLSLIVIVHDTIDIARRMGARVFQNPFVHQVQQFNWALDNCEIKTDWLWRIDADEYIEDNLGFEVKKAIEMCDNDVNGIYVNKKIIFLGKPLLHGGWYLLQGFWYRYLVDSKIYELKKRLNFDDERIKQYLTDKYLILNKNDYSNNIKEMNEIENTVVEIKHDAGGKILYKSNACVGDNLVERSAYAA